MNDDSSLTTLTPKVLLVFSELFYGKGQVTSAQLSVIYKDEDGLTCRAVLTADKPDSGFKN